MLAAGRGERLRPLTDTTPKPLLKVGGRTLIERQIARLVAGGFTELVVNIEHLGEQVENALGDGSRLGAAIRYSRENPALETAGGIARALPLLGDEPFAVVSADIHTAFDYATLGPIADAIARDFERHAAHFVLVDNPPWHSGGDMGLANGRVARGKPWFTYGNISVFHPASFAPLDPNAKLRIFPWAYAMVDAGRVTGEYFGGDWDNVGTAEQLAALDRRLSA
ncbi:N-acetylmuramate alpha-1-phosphate uridylyltransferase [Usitatibacter palustris]|uniref:N-acetylmuramate alpha-1-phosphate uridylyltransferase n=1 Tax=Usitatibacter palustris TaxID=2732487 RepID=A0A6M4H575_9PROT|nr:N-acetylmuramate alpha-1-phosphate uridylyltransferase [Usitatibacter palustris]